MRCWGSSSRSRVPPHGLGTGACMDATGLVPWWFTLAANSRRDTSLLAADGVDPNGPGDEPVGFVP
ncbi:MAG: hypothetical protein ACODAD_02185 [Planctomycetota bacterium]